MSCYVLISLLEDVWQIACPLLNFPIAAESVCIQIIESNDFQQSSYLWSNTMTAAVSMMTKCERLALGYPLTHWVRAAGLSSSQQA